MNFLTLSKDIKGIIKLYLLPCRKQIECNKKLVLDELCYFTLEFKTNLDCANIKATRYVKYGRYWLCDFKN